jgi:AraC-like DNA-binding protein
MVSQRCRLAVKEVLTNCGIHFVIADLGEVEIMEDLSVEVRNKIRTGLHDVGLELMDDKKAILIEKIKSLIIQLIHTPDTIIRIKISDYLSEKLEHPYSYLAKLFPEVQGITIEQFIIKHKIERIKELIIYDEMNFSEIAFNMNYSSGAHLSNQFKKETGLTPTEFKKLGTKIRKPLESIGDNRELAFNHKD